jgi:hypothetical protein
MGRRTVRSAPEWLIRVRQPERLLPRSSAPIRSVPVTAHRPRYALQYGSGTSARHELERLIAAYGIEGFAIVDGNFIVNKAKVGDICDHVTGLGFL